MIRYLIALFLINTYSRSLGAPAVLQTSSPALHNLLDAQAKNCGNLFIRTQIGNVLSNCSTTDHIAFYECLMFYDINSQLCSAINNSKNFKLNEEEFLAQEKQEVNVKDLCTIYAKDWTFSSNYNLNLSLSKVFHDPIKCEKLCGVYDVFSTDSNFYCKYFNWGWKKLNPPKEPVSQSLPKGSSIGEQSQGVITTNPKLGQNLSSGQSIINTQIQKNEDQNDLNDIKIPVTPRPSEGNSARSTLLTVTVESTEPAHGVKENENVKLSSDTNVGNKPNTSNKNNNITSQLNKPHSDQVPKVEDDNGDENLANEMDGDDDDNEIEDPDLAENPVPPKEISTGDFSHRDYYYTPELTPENDHFFPFFLTAIVLVVLVYILYHNKGRVTKVILGLIVEGRQNGRRRNSRGHAYRRLDTLEQAMSGNLAAQPSKIIY